MLIWVWVAASGQVTWHKPRLSPLLRQWVQPFTAVLGLSVGLSAQAADAPATGFEQAEVELRGELAKTDARQQREAEFLRHGPPNCAVDTVDLRGRSLADDWKQYVLDGDEASVLANLRKSANNFIDNGQLADAAAAINLLRARLRRDAVFQQDLVRYWAEVGCHPTNRSVYIAMLRDAGVEPHLSAEIDALEREFATEVREGSFGPAVHRTYPQIEALRQRGAQRDSMSLAKLATPTHLPGLYPIDGDGNCVSADRETRHTSHVRRDRERSPTMIFYPPDAMQREEVGMIYVGVLISRPGCVKKAAVFGSSGYETLDRAAVRYVMTLRFSPLVRRSAPIDSLTVLPVGYKPRPVLQE